MTSSLFRPILACILVLICFLTGGSEAALAGESTTWLDSTRPEASSGFEQAIAPRSWEFPQDFGPHEAYQTEWWYYTGNLETAEGRPFGFQLTFFRQGLQPEQGGGDGCGGVSVAQSPGLFRPLYGQRY